MSDKKKVEWKLDDGMWEGSCGGEHLFSIEDKGGTATVYQMKKPIGNYRDVRGGLDAAREYCQSVLLPDYLLQKSIKEKQKT